MPKAQLQIQIYRYTEDCKGRDARALLRMRKEDKSTYAEEEQEGEDVTDRKNVTMIYRDGRWLGRLPGHNWKPAQLSFVYELLEDTQFLNKRIALLEKKLARR